MWWNQLGFSKNPYFGEELDVSETSRRLFVGREKELASMLIDMAEDDRALICIGGNNGSGKTSFINFCQFLSYANSEELKEHGVSRILPAFTKIQLHENEDYVVFLLKVLSSIVASVEEHCAQSQIHVPESVGAFAKAIESAVTESGGWGGGASAFGFGLNANRTRTASFRDSPLTRESSLVSMIEDAKDVILRDLGFAGVAVAIDNIETLSEAYLQSLLNYGRDSVLAQKGIWWYLIGQKNIGRQVETTVPRLRGFMSGVGIDLAPSQPNDVIRMLELRKEVFGSGPSATLPVSVDTTVLLYNASGGDLRFTFGMCAGIVRHARKELPSLALSERLAAIAINDLTRAHFAHLMEFPRIGDFVRRYLEAPTPCVTADDYETLGLSSPMEMDAILSQLVTQQLMWRDISVHGAVSYRPRGYLQLAIAPEFNRVEALS